MSVRRPGLTVLLLLAALPLLLAAGLIIPNWLRFLLQVSLAAGLATLGVAVQMRTGLVSFSQGLYYCLGGYAAGMAGHFLAITDAFVLLALGLAVSSLVASVLGLLLARYREIFFAMLSLAFSMILYGLLVNAEALGSTDGFNLPKSTFLGFAPQDEAFHFSVYALTCVITVATVGLVQRYLVSGLGAAGEALRENELRVEYLGTSAKRAAYLTYVIAAAISGLGGTLAALSIGHVDPDMAYWTTSGQFVFVALLSGTGHAVAPLVGSFLIELVRVYAVEISPNTWQMILGGVMLLVIIFLPGGLWSLVAMRQRKG